MTGRSDPEPIEDYLDDLLQRLHLPPRDTRRLLTETESHLHETAELLQARGMSATDAEREAVHRFGTAPDVASVAEAAHRRSGWAILIHGVWICLALAGVGLLAVGISGALAALVNAIAGPHFVGALPETYPSSTCAYYLTAHPAAANCAQAATWENSQDAVTLRALAGLLGIVLLLLAWGWRRTSTGNQAASALCEGGTAAFAAVAFCAAAALLIGASIDLAVQHGSGGVGFYLTGGIAAACGATASGLWSHRRLRHLRVWRFTHRSTPVSA